jgi:N-acetylneuraminic acid mutarotase
MFDPSKNSWTTIPTANAPSGRYLHTATWVDKPSPRMCIFGGYSGSATFGDGACYDPTENGWSSIGDVLPTRREHSAVWTGSVIVYFGGLGFDGTTDDVWLNDTALYDPEGDSWSSPSAGQPSVRARHTAVWTASAMIVWGGATAGSSGLSGDGGVYTPTNGTWSGMSGAPPEARHRHTAVWVPGRMIVWGGEGKGGLLATGGVFDPGSATWDARPMPMGPAARSSHTAVGTSDQRMIVWGGQVGSGHTDTGGIFTLAR